MFGFGDGVGDRFSKKASESIVDINKGTGGGSGGLKRKQFFWSVSDKPDKLIPKNNIKPYWDNKLRAINMDCNGMDFKKCMENLGLQNFDSIKCIRLRRADEYTEFTMQDSTGQYGTFGRFDIKILRNGYKTYEDYGAHKYIKEIKYDGQIFPYLYGCFYYSGPSDIVSKNLRSIFTLLTSKAITENNYKLLAPSTTDNIMNYHNKYNYAVAQFIITSSLDVVHDVLKNPEQYKNTYVKLESQIIKEICELIDKTIKEGMYCTYVTLYNFGVKYYNFRIQVKILNAYEKQPISYDIINKLYADTTDFTYIDMFHMSSLIQLYIWCKILFLTTYKNEIRAFDACKAFFETKLAEFIDNDNWKHIITTYTKESYNNTPSILTDTFYTQSKINYILCLSKLAIKNTEEELVKTIVHEIESMKLYMIDRKLLEHRLTQPQPLTQPQLQPLTQPLILVKPILFVDNKKSTNSAANVAKAVGAGLVGIGVGVGVGAGVGYILHNAGKFMLKSRTKSYYKSNHNSYHNKSPTRRTKSRIN